MLIKYAPLKQFLEQWVKPRPEASPTLQWESESSSSLWLHVNVRSASGEVYAALIARRLLTLASPEFKPFSFAIKKFLEPLGRTDPEKGGYLNLTLSANMARLGVLYEVATEESEYRAFHLPYYSKEGGAFIDPSAGLVAIRNEEDILLIQPQRFGDVDEFYALRRAFIPGSPKPTTYTEDADMANAPKPLPTPGRYVTGINKLPGVKSMAPVTPIPSTQPLPEEPAAPAVAAAATPTPTPAAPDAAAPEQEANAPRPPTKKFKPTKLKPAATAVPAETPTDTGKPESNAVPVDPTPVPGPEAVKTPPVETLGTVAVTLVEDPLKFVTSVSMKDGKLESTVATFPQPESPKYGVLATDTPSVNVPTTETGIEGKFAHLEQLIESFKILLRDIKRDIEAGKHLPQRSDKILADVAETLRKAGIV